MRSKPMILVALLLAAFAINLDTTLVNVALPSLVRELHATTTQLQWVVDAYNLVFAALLLTFGSLSDRLGRKGVLLAGLVVFGAIAGVAIALGPIAGGWLLEHFSWDAIFIAMGRVAAAGVLLVAVAVPTSKNPASAAIDVAGLVLSTAAMALLVFTIIEAPDYGWGSTRSLAGFAVSAVLLAAFIGWERRAAHP